MLNKTLIDFYFRHILPFLFVSFCTMSRKVVCRSKCCSQGGGKSRYVVVGWEQGFGNAPPPCLTPRTPPPPRIILLNCRSFDNMDELSGRVNFTNEFSERFSKRYLPFAKSEETIDRKTAIIMVGCLRTVKKTRLFVHKPEPSNTSTVANVQTQQDNVQSSDKSTKFTRFFCLFVCLYVCLLLLMFLSTSC